MHQTEYHKKIIEYYRLTEHAYRDSWDLNNSLAIHYGYWDEKVKSFPQSLLRMNEVMMEAAAIKKGDHVLDAGCGIGGSSIFLARQADCKVTGITLSERQVQQAEQIVKEKGMHDRVDFRVMNYCNTDFPDNSFDVVWGCESICYADNKEQFVREAYRLLKPGGHLVVADGFVTVFSNNHHPVVRHWLDGWQVNYLETTERFSDFMKAKGFCHISYRDISKEISHSSRRLNRFYYLASLYLLLRKVSFWRTQPAEMQKLNIRACKYQYLGLKKGLWQYGLIKGQKPG